MLATGPLNFGVIVLKKHASTAKFNVGYAYSNYLGVKNFALHTIFPSCTSGTAPPPPQA